MKMGVILEIRGKKAFVLENGGDFKQIKAKKGWKKGDVVPIEARKSKAHTFCAAAACLAFFCLFLFSGLTSYQKTTAVISLDINPSIEIMVNRYNRVVGVKGYNAEGEKLLNGAGLKNKEVVKALELLLHQDLTRYLRENDYISITIQSNIETQEDLSVKLKTLADEVVKLQNSQAQVSFHEVDEETLLDAHKHHTTAGKYLELLKLKEVMPDMDIQEYSHCGIGEIHTQIDSCEREHESSLEGDESQEHEHGHNKEKHHE